MQLTDLALVGVLERRDVKRRFHVTIDSVRRWAVGYRPDLLATLVSMPDGASFPQERVG